MCSFIIRSYTSSLSSSKIDRQMLKSIRIFFLSGSSLNFSHRIFFYLAHVNDNGGAGMEYILFIIIQYSQKEKACKMLGFFFFTFIDVIHELSVLFIMRSSVFHKFFFYGKQGLYKYTIILYYYSLTLSS